MTLATRHKIVRLFGGRFTEKGDFIHQPKPAPRRYKCDCNPNGFVAGQIIKHYSFCPFNPRNIQRKRKIGVALVVIGGALFSVASVLYIAFV